jgi:hypothetical protein
MADNKPKRSGTGRATASKSSATKARAKPKSTSTGSRTASTRKSTSASRTASAKKPASSNGRAKSTSSSNGRAKSSSSTASANRSSRSTAPARSTASRNGSGDGHGIVDTVKQAATKAKGPAIAVGAAAAGVAGGIALKARGRRKTVLGVPLPKHLPSVDAKSLAKTVGEASAQFAKTSKSVSKDIERAGDQAERIGKILK